MSLYALHIPWPKFSPRFGHPILVKWCLANSLHADQKSPRKSSFENPYSRTRFGRTSHAPSTSSRDRATDARIDPSLTSDLWPLTTTPKKPVPFEKTCPLRQFLDVFENETCPLRAKPEDFN
jgi:hypothetical protein